MHPVVRFLFCFILLKTPLLLAVELPDMEEVMKQLNRKGGWAVHVGATDGAMEMAIHEAGSFNVTGLAYTAKDAAASRQALSEAAQYGEVTIHEVIQTERLPFPSNIIAVLIVQDSVQNATGLSEEEMMRVLRPQGVLVIQKGATWKILQKAEDPETDDWTHYEYNAGSANRSGDERVGPSRSLQWLDGDVTMNTDDLQMRSIQGIHVTAVRNTAGSRLGGTMTATLTARDAFSGAVLWTRPGILVASRWAFMVDDERVYVNAASGEVTMDLRKNLGQAVWPLRAFDLHSGEDVRTYDEGIKGAISDGGSRGPGRLMHTVVTDGVIVQSFKEHLAVLDARSGKRLWSKSLDEGEWQFPRAAGGRLFMVRGDQKIRKLGYLSETPSMTVKAIDAFDLRSGTPLWSYDNQLDEDHVTYMAADDEVVATFHYPKDGAQKGKLVQHLVKGDLMVQVLDAKTGQLKWTQQSSGPSGFNDTKGGGHFNRLALGDSRVWVTGPSGSVGYGIHDKTDILRRTGGRNFHCATAVLTPNWSLGAQYYVNLEDWSKNFFTNAFRGRCDFGPLPANGFVYNQNGSHCKCAAFVRSYAAYGEERFPQAPWQGTRHLKGSASPASSSGSDTGWPMWMYDAKRSNWTEQSAPDAPALSWSVMIKRTETSNPVLQDQWDSHADIPYPITAATVVGSRMCVADSHGHEIVGLDATTGQELWRTRVDGRIDSAPTQHDGMVYAGTRTGFVYALNAEDGALVWRYFVAPHQRLILAYGQAESAWPVFGSLIVQDGAIWATAGRQAELDYGLYWAALDPKTGEVKREGHFGQTSDWHAYPRGMGLHEDHPLHGTAPSREKGPYPLHGVNGPMMSNGRYMVWWREGFDLETAEPISFSDFKVHKAGWTKVVNFKDGKYGDVLEPGTRWGLLRPDTAGYGGINGLMFAFKGDDVFRVGQFGIAKYTIQDWTLNEGYENRHRSKSTWSVKNNENIEQHWSQKVMSTGRDKNFYFSAMIRATNHLVTVEPQGKVNPTNSILRLRSLETGEVLHEVPAKHAVMYQGAALANGAVYLTGRDGSLMCYQ